MTKHALNILKDRGVDFISLTEKIDTTTPGGKLIVQCYQLTQIQEG